MAGAVAGDDEDGEAEAAEVALNQLQRLLDHEMRGTEEVDRKLSQLLGLTAAILGASVPFFGTLFPQNLGWTYTHVQWTALALLGAGFVSILVSALLLLDGYVGLNKKRRPEWSIGPTPDKMRERVFEDEISADRLTLGLVWRYPDYIEQIGDQRKDVLWIRTHAIYCVIFGLLLYGAASFILWL